MSEQIIFFDKNKLDIDKTNVVITASQGNAYTSYMQNRSNLTAWLTTGSVDADNTNIVIDFVDQALLTDIVLVKHNFKAYTIQYWNSSMSAYVDFSTPIAETANALETTHHVFTQVTTTKIKLIITGTVVVNADKYLYQLIASNRIGQLTAWPVIQDAIISRGRVSSKAISGKYSIRENVGGFSCKLAVEILKDDTDLNIIESLYSTNEGFLVWLCGGDAAQFSTDRIGYRLQDFYTCKCKDELSSVFYQGIYKSGMKINIDLVEVID